MITVGRPFLPKDAADPTTSGSKRAPKAKAKAKAKGRVKKEVVSPKAKAKNGSRPKAAANKV